MTAARALAALEHVEQGLQPGPAVLAESKDATMQEGLAGEAVAQRAVDCPP
jgi:hypothetical protein